MITTIINALFSISLFVTGGNIVSTNLKLHHYSDEDYKGIFYLKNNDSITKHCLKHSELEDIRKMLSNKYKNDFFQVLWMEDNQDFDPNSFKDVGLIRKKINV